MVRGVNLIDGAASCAAIAICRCFCWSYAAVAPVMKGGLLLPGIQPAWGLG